MSGAPGGAGGFLEFFILEAGDYVEQLDGILLGGSRTPRGPDSEALQRLARALRGTATMAKIPSFADVAGGVERVGRALQDGALQWNPAISGALTSAIDDLKILLRGARSWTPSEDQRAATRSAELARLAPPNPMRTGTPAVGGAVATSPTAFLGTEASNIAAGLELLTTRAGDADTAANVLRRVRALRGVAGVKEIGPLADALEATEDAARGLETGEEELGNASRHLLEAAAAYLRTLSGALRGNGDVNAPSSSRDAFAAALEMWAGRDAERERVVPISTLFYGDSSTGLVEESQNPPTSMAERFRLEVVSLGEHLRQVVDAARHPSDSGSAVRVRRELKRALGALRGAADSFGEHDIAEYVAGHLGAADHADAAGLSTLEDLAAVLTQPGVQGDLLTARLRAIARGGEVTPPAAFPPPAVSAPTSVTASLLDQTISALESFAATPMLEPTRLPEEQLVPIDTLLYRGRSALDRAIEVRDALRGGKRDPASLEELFDLLELARAE